MARRGYSLSLLYMGIAFLAFAAMLPTSAWSQAKKPAASKASPKANAKPDAPPVPAAPASPAAKPSPELAAILKVPTGDDAAVLTKYLETALGFEPKTPEDMQIYNEQAPLAMTKVATKILDVEKDTTSAGYMLAQRYLIAMDVMAIASATPAERRELVGIICEGLKQPSVTADDVEIAIAMVDELENAGDLDSARYACQNFAEVFQASKDESLAELGSMMASAGRRFGLVGQPVDIQGASVDGKPFRWNSLRGKVVLIDFWSTSCGPCREEFPQLKSLYEAYKAKGFEIVGVNMDEDSKEVAKFLETEKLPWITLQEDAADKDAPSIRYGVLNLPTTFLVDKQGKVVALNARGDALAKSLETLLGPATVRR